MISNTKNYYCCEDISLIENYDEAIKDTKQVWDCHHRNEITLNVSASKLKEMGLFYYRPANELIYLPHSEHISLHSKGIIPWQKGKTGVYSESTIKQMSESAKKRGKMPESAKKQGETMKKKYASGEIQPHNKGKSKFDGKISAFMLWYYLNIENLKYCQVAEKFGVERNYLRKQTKLLGIDKHQPLKI